MTVRAKKRPENPEEEPSGRLVLEYGKFNQSIRYTILIAALSATPFGQQILKTMGVTSPAAEQVEKVQVKVDKTSSDVDAIKDRMQNLESKVEALDVKVQTLVSGFQIDFQRYRPQPTPAPNTQQ